MRRRYVVSYDVADDRRRNKVLELLDGYGDHVQYSVFLADLTEQELVQLRVRLREIINEREDQVLIVDLGRASGAMSESAEVLGKPYAPTVRSIVI